MAEHPSEATRRFIELANDMNSRRRQNAVLSPPHPEQEISGRPLSSYGCRMDTDDFAFNHARVRMSMPPEGYHR